MGIDNYGGFIPGKTTSTLAFSEKMLFIKALKQNLNPDYYFQFFETNGNFNVMIPPMKIRIKNIYIAEVNFLLKNRCESGDGVYIDVDVFDKVSGNKFTDELFRIDLRC